MFRAIVVFIAVFSFPYRLDLTHSPLDPIHVQEHDIDHAEKSRPLPLSLPPRPDRGSIVTLRDDNVICDYTTRFPRVDGRRARSRSIYRTGRAACATRTGAARDRAGRGPLGV